MMLFFLSFEYEKKLAMKKKEMEGEKND